LINSLLSPQVQSFIAQHLDDDVNQLLLKYKTVNDVPISLIVDQIVGRKKAFEKIPTWSHQELIVYPPGVNVEQCSSEKAATIKTDLVKDQLGLNIGSKSMVDLTGGFGVDSFFFSKIFKEVHFVEPNANLLEIAKHNHRQLGATNIHYYNTKAEAFLISDSIKKNFDLIYIDPSRRSSGNQKIFSLNQCEPNIIALQPEIWKAGKTLLLKTSPLLDISAGLNDLQFVKKVCVTAIHNECKELLFYCEKNFQSEPIIDAVNLNAEKFSFSFSISAERDTKITYSDPLKFVYEPNAALLKSGAFKTIASLFNIYKLHPNTHLYTSDHIVPDFPGRIFEIESFLKSDPKIILKAFDSGRANIFVRNYPLTVNEIRKKTGLNEGGDKFLIGCSGISKKFLMVGSRLNRL